MHGLQGGVQHDGTRLLLELLGGGLERITLGARGTVFSYTIVRQQLPGALVQAPYVMARVKLPEGVTVQTIITDIELEEVTIGMAVEICLKQLTEDDEQRAVVNFFFRPAKA